MKVCVIQLSSTDNKNNNIQRSIVFIKKAISQRATFILLPEIFIHRGQLTQKERFDLAESIPGPTTRIFQEISKKSKVFLLLGSIFEKTGTGQRVYNTSVFINNRGEIAAKYRKIHLFDAIIQGRPVKESNYFIAGKRKVMSRMGSFNIGLSICYDIRFPLLYNYFLQKKAHILTVPSAFTYQTGKLHWEILLRSRAIENMCYVLAPNQVGPDGKGGRHYGHSMIIAPSGKILAQADGEKEKLIYANMSMHILREDRKMFPNKLLITRS